MTGRGALTIVAVALTLAGCATKPTVELTPQEQYEPESVVVPPMTPAADPPPIEPVEPPPVQPPPQTPPQTSPAPPEPVREPPPTNVAVLTPPPVQPSAPLEPSEDQQLLALLADLQRYGTLTADDLRRELGTASAALTKQRNDANRVRLAVLYTMIRATPADDQRAMQLFENVARNNPSPTPIKQLAAVLQAQVVERQKAIRDEQQKADKAIQKLEALREMERSLMRDRVRSGGGGGGAGGAGGSGH